jgi:hypothetical protein
MKILLAVDGSESTARLKSKVVVGGAGYGGLDY